MSVNAKKLGISSALIAGVFYAVCALLAAVMPASLNAFFGFVMHVNLNGLSRPISWISFVAGMVIYSALIGMHVLLIAALYDKLSERTRQGRLVPQ